MLTDISYIPYDGKYALPSHHFGRLYKTDQIRAYPLSSSMEVDFVLETVNKLIEKHSISLSQDTMIHSDHETFLLAIVSMK